MNRIKKWITNNLDIKLLALVMAIILWFYISSEYNIMAEKYFEIDITPINLNKNLSIKEIRDKANVGIKGPQNIVENLTATKITGKIDLKNISEAGEYLVPLNITSPKNTEVTKIIPEDSRIIIEKIINQEYSLEYNLIGLPEKGYSLKEEPDIAPKNVSILAPESIHKTIEHVRIDIDISAINKNIKKEEEVKVYKKDNNIIDNLDIKPEKVLVSIQVREGYPEKLLEIKPRIVGKPAPGFYISKIEAKPNKFQIYGEFTKLNSIEFLETIPIDVNGISKTLTVKVPPIISEGIFLADNQEVLAEVQIQVEEKEEEKIFQNIKIELKDASPFINYKLIPEFVNIKISGKYDIVKNLKDEDIQAFVNLSDTDAEKVHVETILPPEVNMVDISPKEVNITIKK